MADEFEVVERFVADVNEYVRNLERAAREADQFGEQNSEAREAVRRFGDQAQRAAERAARAQRAAMREAQALARGEGDVERAARAAARATRELERAEMAQQRAARRATQQAEQEAEQYEELARQARRAAAEQQLARMRAAGQIEQHNQLLRRLRQEYEDFGDDSGEAFRMMESRARQTFNGIRNSGVSNIAATRAAILLLPLAASLAASAITLGVGGALAFVAMKAQASNEEVKASYSALKKHVVSELKAWSTPYKQTLLDLSKFGRRTFDAFGDDLRAAFAETAPAVSEFADEVARGFEQFAPVIRNFAHSFTVILDDLGPRMDDILGNLADGLDSIADAAERNPEEFGELVEALSEGAKFAGTLTGILAPLSSGLTTLGNIMGGVNAAIGPLAPLLDKAAQAAIAFSNPVSAAVFTFKKVKDGLAQAGIGAEQAAPKMAMVDRSMTGLGRSADQANQAQTRSGILMRLASQEADKLKASLDALAGKELSSREAAAQYGLAVQAMTKSLKDNGKAHGFNTAKGIQNEQALTSLAQAAQQNAVAMRDNGKGAKEVAKFMEGARRKFVQSAVAAGYSRDEANKLADKLYGVKVAANSIPKKKHTKVTADTSQAKSTVERFKDWVGRQVARINVKSLWPFSEGGPVAAFADGGMAQTARRISGSIVRGAGTGTSDSIIARLSNGEFVNTARATRMFGPVLAMMNRVAAGGGGSPTAMAAPAPALPRAAHGGTTVIQHVTHVHVAGSVIAERQLLDVVQRQGNRRNIRNPGTALLGTR